MNRLFFAQTTAGLPEGFLEEKRSTAQSNPCLLMVRDASAAGVPRGTQVRRSRSSVLSLTVMQPANIAQAAVIARRTVVDVLFLIFIAFRAWFSECMAQGSDLGIGTFIL